MAKPNFETFLDLLQRSGLIDKDRLQEAIAQSPKGSSGNSTTDVDELAQYLVSIGLITRWQSERLLEGRHRGFFLGCYKLLDLVAAGGMSTVYLAEHVLMQRRVAIKVLPKTRVTDTSYLARFHREAQASASLDHNNIVRVYDVDNDGDIHYMVMEYVEGRDLQRIVKQDGRMSYAMAADYIRQAAEGLAHAHAAALIHRDVKPANLLVDPKGVVKVLDLGLARFTDDTKASLTVQYDENVLGTADYLAPEQAIDSHGVDARADIYSLGCSLYYLLTGHPPFPDGTLPQRLMAHQRTQPPSILIDRPDCPADLVEICMKMMAKKAADRYSNMFDVAQVLQRWLNNFNSDLGNSGLGSTGGGSGVRTAAAGSRSSPTSSGRMPTLSNGAQSGIPTVAISGAVAQRVASRASALSPSKNPALSDTVASADAESRTPKPRKGGDSNWLSEGKKAALPVARPLDEPLSLPAKPADAVDVESIFGNGALSGSIVRSSGVAVAARPKSKRVKGFQPPKWIWAAIGGMFLAGLLLVILLISMPNRTPSSPEQPKSSATSADSAKPAGPLFPDAPGSKHLFPDAPGSTKPSK